MSNPFGVGASGFTTPSQADLVAQENADVLATIGNDTDVSPGTPVGAVVADTAKKNEEIWNVLATSYLGTNRGACTGAQLDNVGSLFGCRRLPASYSSVQTSCVFTAPGTIVAGALVGFIQGQSSQQASNASAVTVPSSVNGTPVSISNPYTTPVLFTAPVTGPNFGNALIAANATNPGNVGAFTGQLPVSGWLSVVDVSSPSIGSAVESDVAYQARQVEELGTLGSCTLSAIESDVVEALQTAPSPVRAPACKVHENTSDYIDTTGLPPHSYRVVVFDGINPNTAQNDALIAQAVWSNKPGGLRPQGAGGGTTVTVALTDPQGIQRSVTFVRPTARAVFLVINVAIASTADPVAVTAAIVDAVTAASQGAQFTAYGNAVYPASAAPYVLDPGVDVVPQAVAGIAQGQAGVVQVTSVLAGFAPNPTSSNVLRISPLQLAVLASGAQGTGVVVQTSVFQP